MGSPSPPPRELVVSCIHVWRHKGGGGRIVQQAWPPAIWAQARPELASHSSPVPGISGGGSSPIRPPTRPTFPPTRRTLGTKGSGLSSEASPSPRGFGSASRTVAGARFAAETMRPPSPRAACPREGGRVGSPSPPPRELVVSCIHVWRHKGGGGRIVQQAWPPAIWAQARPELASHSSPVPGISGGGGSPIRPGLSFALSRRQSRVRRPAPGGKWPVPPRRQERLPPWPRGRGGPRCPGPAAPAPPAPFRVGGRVARPPPPCLSRLACRCSRSRRPGVHPPGVLTLPPGLGTGDQPPRHTQYTGP